MLFAFASVLNYGFILFKIDYPLRHTTDFYLNLLYLRLNSRVTMLQ
nr:MAG TPA: hypothetical protein [Caudoviricetes sp.]